MVVWSNLGHAWLFMNSRSSKNAYWRILKMECLPMKINNCWNLAQSTKNFLWNGREFWLDYVKVAYFQKVFYSGRFRKKCANSISSTTQPNVKKLICNSDLHTEETTKVKKFLRLSYFWNYLQWRIEKLFQNQSFNVSFRSVFEYT